MKKKVSSKHFRQLFTCVAIIVMAVFLLVPVSGAAQIKELKIGIGVDADTLNPQEQTTTLFQNICDLIYDNLYFQDPEGNLIPRLLSKHEASEDGLTWTLHLQKGVQFSDGSAFNADVVKQTWDRILDPKMRVPLRFAVSMVKECVKIDDYTVQLNLKYAFAPLNATMSMALVSSISPKALETYGEDVRQHPVGAGPYVLSEWVKGDRIVLTRNEKYWGKTPTVDKITFKIIPEDTTREAMLRTGEIDICYKPLPSNVANLKTQKGITVEMPLDTRTIFMGLNCQKGVTMDKKVRQAFNYAVDKKAIVERILFNTAQPMDGPVSPKVFGYVKMDHQYDYNPEKAKQLLKEANFDFSKTISMRTPNGRYLFDKQVSEVVQASLQAIGVK